MSAPAGEHVERSLGQLVSTATSDMSALIHDEIALAKAELRADVKRAALGSTATIVAGVLILFGFPMLSFALAYGLHAAGIWLWAAFLISFGVHLVLGLLVALVGVMWLRKIKKPEKTIASVQETAQVFSGVRPGRRRSHAARRAGDDVRYSRT
ncbi:phage holin family protein [Streptomyces polyrhachis]|uniref:Phage holin family protein n=1 Tax=Streptomyces polyrhachis TaxID=1282885 RepID=A0ABW2GH21_9ACTN